jgi:hypothetical protein
LLSIFHTLVILLGGYYTPSFVDKDLRFRDSQEVAKQPQQTGRAASWLHLNSGHMELGKIVVLKASLGKKLARPYLNQ